jgi:hypothetical protein
MAQTDMFGGTLGEDHSTIHASLESQLDYLSLSHTTLFFRSSFLVPALLSH